MSDNKTKKIAKQRANAERVWEREQIKAATAQERLEEARAVVEQFKAELNEAQEKEVLAKFDERQQEIKDLLMRAHTAYTNKIKALDGTV